MMKYVIFGVLMGLIGSFGLLCVRAYYRYTIKKNVAQSLNDIDKATALDYVDRALRLARKRLNRIRQVNNGASLIWMYDSIVQQLIYLHNAITGKEKDKSKIRKMTMGIYACKEFEGADPIFADRISSADCIADQIGHGIKVRFPHDIEPDYFKKQQKLRAEYPDDFDV